MGLGILILLVWVGGGGEVRGGGGGGGGGKENLSCIDDSDCVQLGKPNIFKLLH